jgi:maltose phosphorylase
VNNARLVVNGRYYGLFVNIEHVNKDFLERNFGDAGDGGNLYKGGELYDCIVNAGGKIELAYAPKGPKGKFGYYAVMGPDEFQMMVNNNAYTNYMAKRTFEFTLKALEGMDLTALGCARAELDEWKHMAAEMILPYDPQTKLYEQHEGFFNLPHIDVDAIPVEDFPLYHHWSYDRIYRTDMIKQPDVLMFLFLYNRSFTLAEKQANYDYYEPRCIHESSLSPSVHSIFAAELGRPEEAFDFFRFATRIDLDNYNRNTHEGIHTTSIAAAWMNIVYGFGGMRSTGSLQSHHPLHWKSYCFGDLWRLRDGSSQAGGFL